MLIERPHITPSEFQGLLERFDRVAVSGVVNSGKSLLLTQIDGVTSDRQVFHTDDLQARGLEWEQYPDVVLSELGGVPRFVLVGMQVPRILRKGLEVDAVVWVNQPRGRVTKRQGAFSKGARTIMHKWRREKPDIPVYFFHRALHEDGS